MLPVLVRETGIRVDFIVVDIGEVERGTPMEDECDTPFVSGKSKGWGCENVRLRVVAPGCEDDVLPFGEKSAVMVCCRLGRGIALGFWFCEVGVAVLSCRYAAFEAKVSELYSSFVDMIEAADIRLDKAWLSCSRPVAERCIHDRVFRFNGIGRTLPQSRNNGIVPYGIVRQPRCREDGQGHDREAGENAGERKLARIEKGRGLQPIKWQMRV